MDVVKDRRLDVGGILVEVYRRLSTGPFLPRREINMNQQSRSKAKERVHHHFSLSHCHHLLSVFLATIAIFICLSLISLSYTTTLYLFSLSHTNTLFCLSLTHSLTHTHQPPRFSLSLADLCLGNFFHSISLLYPFCLSCRSSYYGPFLRLSLVGPTHSLTHLLTHSISLSNLYHCQSLSVGLFLVTLFFAFSLPIFFLPYSLAQRRTQILLMPTHTHTYTLLTPYTFSKDIHTRPYTFPLRVFCMLNDGPKNVFSLQMKRAQLLQHELRIDTISKFQKDFP